MRVGHPLVLLALTACASGGPSPGQRPTQTVQVTGSSGGNVAIGMAPTNDANVAPLAYAPADVWRVLPSVYESFTIPVNSVDSKTKVIGNNGYNIRRRLGSIPLPRLLDCGTTQGGPSAETYDVKFSILTEVRAAEGGGSAIATTIDAMGRPAAFSGEYVRCSSTGVLESRIADAVKAKLAK